MAKYLAIVESLILACAFLIFLQAGIDIFWLQIGYAYFVGGGLILALSLSVPFASCVRAVASARKKVTLCRRYSWHRGKGKLTVYKKR